MAGKILVEIEPIEVAARVQAGAIFIDVREADEHALGLPTDAIALPRRQLEASPAQYIPLLTSSVILICAAGTRSALACKALQACGYTDVASVQGGFQHWQQLNLPVAANSMIDEDFRHRYDRHLRLPNVGIAGQKKLQAASVAIIGAGGLGSPAAFYLAAAGVGRIRLIDDDRVDRSNLQRQILHTDADVGRSKVYSAAERLSALNPSIVIDTITARLAADSVDSLLKGIDLIIDGADNFPTRYLLSDYCVHRQKPMIYGAVERFTGQVSVFDAGRQRGKAPCYRCLFPKPPSADEAPNCAQAGVLGVLPGIIGVLQATETVKLILGIGEPLIGRLLIVDALSMQFRELKLSPDPDCTVCAADRPWGGYIDYREFCSSIRN